MASKISWDDIEDTTEESKGSSNNNGDLKPLKFVAMGNRGVGNTYKLRPLGRPQIIEKYLVEGSDGKWRSAITDDPDTCPVRINHSKTPSRKYVINVLDRADDEIKILEAPHSVFAVFKKFWQETGENPGGADGADFQIVVNGFSEDSDVPFYETTCVKRTPLTSEEKSMLKEEGLYKLEDIFKPTPVDEIEEKLGLVEPSASSSDTDDITASDDDDGIDDIDW